MSATCCLFCRKVQQDIAGTSADISRLCRCSYKARADDAAASRHSAERPACILQGKEEGVKTINCWCRGWLGVTIQGEEAASCMWTRIPPNFHRLPSRRVSTLGTRSSDIAGTTLEGRRMLVHRRRSIRRRALPIAIQQRGGAHGRSPTKAKVPQFGNFFYF